ncbi:MAG: (2Fe-2S)-binding protein [Acidobacteria bacterium]|nr:(2Fe-2S)-binding protein [Acidobacteriota bacterium]
MVAQRLFLAFLAQHDDGAWQRAVERLERAMHPVDRAATRVWFHLFPLRLQDAVHRSAHPEALLRYLRVQGAWDLAEQRDTSHWFLFGHRYWAEVCAAVRDYAARATPPASLDLAAQVHEVADGVATQLRLDASWLIGITAVAMRTLQQVGLSDAPARPAPESLIGAPLTDPARIVAQRGTVSSGWLDRFRSGPRQWTITFDERRADGLFPLIDTQHLTTAAALDTRDYRASDARCSEGPIPVQCRSCSCGTCRVGVIAGAEHLSAVEPRERSTIASLGYLDSHETHPVIRLACMAEARGPVTLVVPPWNGQIGTRLDRALKGRVELPANGDPT